MPRRHDFRSNCTFVAAFSTSTCIEDGWKLASKEPPVTITVTGGIPLKRRYTITILLALTALFMLGGCVSEEIGSRSGAVTGRVLERSTGRILAGASVTLNGKPAAMLAGTYSLNNLAPGTYALKATAPGFTAFAGNVWIGSSPVNMDIRLDPAAIPSRFGAADLDLMARLVWAESGGEPYSGMVAVAATIFHRVDSPDYPNTIRGVIYQVWDGRYYQYEPVLNGTINLPAGDLAKNAVRDALAGYDPSRGALGFYNPAKTTNQWVRSRPVTAIIGSHVFFR